MRNLIRLGIVACLMFFLVSCAHQKDDSWKEDIASSMKSDVTVDYDKDADTMRLDVLFEQAGGANIRTVWQNVKLVPKDNPAASPFNAARVRIASCAKEKAGAGKYLLDIDMKKGTVFTELFNNPAIKYGEPFVDGYHGIGIGNDGSPGFLVINPDSRWAVYKTVLFGGYKTKFGDKANLNTLIIGVVYYKNKPPRPLREVLAREEISADDFISANRWGYCPELK
ncbi:hypothetical protein KKB98_00910 [Patescibacteria group bacterium]|nr:hypothetical protein [Patescibacteria group bacterium]